MVLFCSVGHVGVHSFHTLIDPFHLAGPSVSAGTLTRSFFTLLFLPRQPLFRFWCACEHHSFGNTFLSLRSAFVSLDTDLARWHACSHSFDCRLSLSSSFFCFACPCIGIQSKLGLVGRLVPPRLCPTSTAKYSRFACSAEWGDNSTTPAYINRWTFLGLRLYTHLVYDWVEAWNFRYA